MTETAKILNALAFALENLDDTMIENIRKNNCFIGEGEKSACANLCTSMIDATHTIISVEQSLLDATGEYR